MPTSKKTRSTKPLKTTDWHQISTSMLHEHSQLVARHPRKVRAAFAQPGMIVTTTGGCGLAIIEALTKDFCIVRFENGTPDAFFWGEVELAAVRPHPRYVSGKGRSHK